MHSCICICCEGLLLEIILWFFPTNNHFKVEVIAAVEVLEFTFCDIVEQQKNKFRAVLYSWTTVIALFAYGHTFFSLYCNIQSCRQTAHAINKQQDSYQVNVQKMRGYTCKLLAQRKLFSVVSLWKTTKLTADTEKCTFCSLCTYNSPSCVYCNVCLITSWGFRGIIEYTLLAWQAAAATMLVGGRMHIGREERRFSWASLTDRPSNIDGKWIVFREAEIVWIKCQWLTKIRSNFRGEAPILLYVYMRIYLCTSSNTGHISRSGVLG
jgi:hypothetical protein